MPTFTKNLYLPWHTPSTRTQRRSASRSRSPQTPGKGIPQTPITNTRQQISPPWDKGAGRGGREGRKRFRNDTKTPLHGLRGIKITHQGTAPHSGRHREGWKNGEALLSLSWGPAVTYVPAQVSHGTWSTDSCEDVLSVMVALLPEAQSRNVSLSFRPFLFCRNSSGPWKDCKDLGSCGDHQRRRKDLTVFVRWSCPCLH